MSLPKLASSPAYYSLVGAHSFVLGQAAWHYRPASLRSSLPQKRTFATTQARSDGQLEEHRQSHDHGPPPSRPPPSPSSATTSSRQAPSSSSSSSPSSSDRASSQASHSPSPAPSDTSSKTSDTRDPPTDLSNVSLPPGWDENPDYKITAFSQLPHRYFGYNQHIKVNEDFKEALRQILWQFNAPIRYAFAYGSGVFGQSKSGKSNSEETLSPHPNPPKAVEEWQKGGAKIIDFIFGVSHTQHWHSLNLSQHPKHYSGLRFIPNASAAISHIQDDLGAGVYFNPYINANGTMIKYGVVNLDTLSKDLSEWNTLYLAGRLQKPVKILRDDPRMRLANQVNLISALRTALLMLPESFTERQLYERIAGLSYLGDPRMQSYFGRSSEDPSKVSNIVGAQLPGFRQLYVPLIQNLPNVNFHDSRTPSEAGWEKEDAIRHTGSSPQLDGVLGGTEGLMLGQDMDPNKRGNMVRRLPTAFRRKIYYQYKKKFGIPGSAFSDILEESSDESDTHQLRRRDAGDFERRIAAQDDLPGVMATCVRRTVSWPSTTQSIKGIFTGGIGRSWQYLSEKRRKGKAKAASAPAEEKAEKDDKND